MSERHDDCPQCGEPSADFSDGVCVECAAQNQAEIDQHLAWVALGPKEQERITRDRLRVECGIVLPK